MGSSGFLIIFACVNAANFVKAKEIKSSRSIAGLGVCACLFALGALVWHTYQVRPGQLWVLCAMVGLAFIVEATFISSFKRKAQKAVKR